MKHRMFLTNRVHSKITQFFNSVEEDDPQLADEMTIMRDLANSLRDSMELRTRAKVGEDGSLDELEQQKILRRMLKELLKLYEYENFDKTLLATFSLIVLDHLPEDKSLTISVFD